MSQEHDYHFSLKREIENARYKDISWLMPSINIEDVLRRIGLEVKKEDGDEIWTFCPDHHLFVKRRPSHPKWSCNKISGKTNCLTESRGSNLVFTLSRLLNVSPDEAVKWLTGVETIDKLHLAAISNKISSLKEKKKDDNIILNEKPSYIKMTEDGIKTRVMLDNGYKYFMSPPNKKPTNITKETVDKFKCFHMTYGWYNGRVIIPFFLNKKIYGFCALDIGGKDKWLKTHSKEQDGDYKKILYPPNPFKLAEYLFGIDDVPVNCENLIIVEGSRDVMKLTQEGFYAVGVLHSGITKEQTFLLCGKNPKHIFTMFDGDNVGYETSRKVKKELSNNFDVTEAILPWGVDPKNMDRNDILTILSKSIDGKK